jgi:hypothetical protein
MRLISRRQDQRIRKEKVYYCCGFGMIRFVFCDEKHSCITSYGVASLKSPFRPVGAFFYFRIHRSPHPVIDQCPVMGVLASSKIHPVKHGPVLTMRDSPNMTDKARWRRGIETHKQAVTYRSNAQAR